MQPPEVFATIVGVFSSLIHLIGSVEGNTSRVNQSHNQKGRRCGATPFPGWWWYQLCRRVVVVVVVVPTTLTY